MYRTDASLAAASSFAAGISNTFVAFRSANVPDTASQVVRNGTPASPEVFGGTAASRPVGRCRSGSRRTAR